MLIAPTIFDSSYQSPSRKESQKPSDSPSSSSASTSTKFNNIFKTALNRSLSFLANTLTRSPSTSATASTSSKPTESENKHGNSSGTPSDCSSPDSIKNEMVFFKPITREPKTPSISKPLRVPSFRSTASSTNISSPCPSPFSIVNTPRRQSAFSFVSYADDDSKESDEPEVVKPKTSKRKFKMSPEMPTSKRIKKENPPEAPKGSPPKAPKDSLPKAPKETPPKARKEKPPKASKADVMEDVPTRRLTRSMKKPDIARRSPAELTGTMKQKKASGKKAQQNTESNERKAPQTLTVRKRATRRRP